MPTPLPPLPETRFEIGFAAHLAVAARSAALLGPPMAAVTAACLRALRGGGKLLLFGNGGSAADAQHIASELTIGFGRRRGGIAALALTTDASALTAAGNDLGFEQVFARQVEALGRPGDVALGLTTSGRSPNVLAALRTARRAGLATIGWTGEAAAELRSLCDHVVAVPSCETPRIQEVHLLLGHILCGEIEQELDDDRPR
ncbi:SIS domain-containing protein [Methylobacterium currus]|uniref:SIS domain-containing protein n=1 Tax=Methylobacterium currus TaxID=2051553 RepID=A0A2R4WUQ8_9HYPH|nr:SIS domain-containing protein [Methylobacterium currus]AWB25238.1 SIS domain-containing protein [Methylobacterium currus]UHC19534.1 SIS domain-containing protein [Methylobacterium currus]